MKKIVFAPQGFKESLTGIEIARAMARGAHAVWPDAKAELVPVADGGDVSPNEPAEEGRDHHQIEADVDVRQPRTNGFRDNSCWKESR